MIPPMPEGAFYSCTDPEELSHTHPWDAVEEYLEGWMEPRMTVAAVEAIVRQGLTITAYVPGVVSDSQIKNWSESLVERLAELMGDEHLNPNEPPELCDVAGSIMLDAVTRIVKATPVWSCEESGEVRLSGDQVLEWARQERPDWFEAEP